MVGSIVVGFAGAPCLEATVLAAVDPGSNPASDGLLLRVIPLSLLSVSFYLSSPLKGIKVFFFLNGRMEASIRARLVKYQLEKNKQCFVA